MRQEEETMAPPNNCGGCVEGKKTALGIGPGFKIGGYC